MPKKVRWVKYIPLIPSHTWIPASQMAEIMKQHIRMAGKYQRDSRVVAMRAGVQSRYTTGRSQEYSINNHEALMAYLRD